MDREREESVRDRAYAIWEEEGRPEGQDKDHWQRAEQEIGQSSSTPEPASAAAATTTPKAESPAAATAPKPAKA